MSVLHINQNNYPELVPHSEKPVLLDFFANWCGPCKLLSPTIDQIAQERPDILVGKVNVDDAPGLVSLFRIASIPTVVIMENGQEIDRVIGLRHKDEILELL